MQRLMQILISFAQSVWEFFAGLVWFLGENAIATILLGAVVTFIVNSHLQRRSNNKQQTFLLLSRIFESGPVSEARLEMAKWVSNGKVIPDDNVSPEEDNVILSILDFYEFVCEGAMARKTVDLKLLNQESGGRIERYFMMCQNYVKARENKIYAYNVSHGREQPVVLYAHMRQFLNEVRGCDV